MLNRRPFPSFGLAAFVAAQNLLMAAALLLRPDQSLWLTAALMLSSLLVGGLMLGLFTKSPEVIADAPLDRPEPVVETRPQPVVLSVVPSMPSPDGSRLADLTAEVDTLQHVLGTLDGALRRLDSGDFGIRLEETFPAPYEGLRGDFNHTVARLEETLQNVTSAVGTLHAQGIELQAQSDLLRTGYAESAAAIAQLAAETGSLLESLRMQDTETGHIATIAHNAVLDLRKPRANDSAAALQSLEKTARDMGPVADRIIEIALEANMAAMNLSLAGRDAAGPAAGGLAEEIRRLAEEAATAARQMAVLGRNAQQEAAGSERSVARTNNELTAVGLYVDALHDKTQTLAAAAIEHRKGATALRLAVTNLTRSSREGSLRVDQLSRQTADLTRHVTLLDRQLGRYTPVTTIQPGSVFKPHTERSDGKPKRPPHLRLV